MITCIIKGGLGNQLFQYAAAKSLAKNHQTTCQWYVPKNETLLHNSFYLPLLFESEKFNVVEELPNFGLKQRIRSRFKARHLRHYVQDNNNINAQKFNAIGKEVIIDGYWQNESLIHPDVKTEIDSQLSPSILKPDYMVAVHLRGGDYVFNKNTSEFHGNLTPTYYKKAMESILGNNSEAEFHLFSDTPEQFKWDLWNEYNCIWFEEKDPIKCFQSLKSYQNYVIANSSFSWWAAYLSHQNKKQILAPKNWFKAKQLKKYNPSLSSWSLISTS